MKTAGDIWVDICDNNIYTIKDNYTLDTLTTSITILYPDHQTRGHAHSNQEEVYIFHSGSGIMVIDNEMYPTKPGDVFSVRPGIFHRVVNDSHDERLEFYCVFIGNRANKDYNEPG